MKTNIKTVLALCGLSVVAASCGTNQISNESIEQVSTLEGRVKPGQVQIVFSTRSNAFENAEIREPGEWTKVGPTERSIAVPTRYVDYGFTSDADANSPDDQSISFRIGTAQAKMNIIVDALANIDPTVGLGHANNAAFLAFLQAHGGLDMESYIRSQKFEIILQNAVQSALARMTEEGIPVTQEEIVLDGQRISTLYEYVEEAIQAGLVKKYGVNASPFTVSVAAGRGEGDDKVQLPQEVEEQYILLATAKAKAAVASQQIEAQKVQNELALVRAEAATVELAAYQQAGLLEAYLELQRIAALEKSNFIIAEPGNQVRIDASKLTKPTPVVAAPSPDEDE
jgi:hypothetical protein